MQAVFASGAREPQFYELAARLDAAAGNPARARVYKQLATQLDPVDAGWREMGIK